MSQSFSVARGLSPTMIGASSRSTTAWVASGTSSDWPSPQPTRPLSAVTLTKSASE